MRVELVDPRSAAAASVLPPLLDPIANDAPGPSAAHWLGNLWQSGPVTAA
jgi:hypothetical protein